MSQSAVSFRKEVASVLRALAKRLDPDDTIETTRRVQAHLAERALLEAEAEEERARYTLAMLRERHERLKRHESHPSAGFPQIAER